MFTIDRKILKTWLGAILSHGISVLCCLTGCSGVENDADVLPPAATMNISVRSSSGESATTDELSVWAYVCDAEGKVAYSAPAAYGYADGASVATLSIAPASRYYLLVALANFSQSIFGESAGFLQLAGSKIGGTITDTKASHWRIVDLLEGGDMAEEVDIPMEIFPMVGKVSVRMTKSSDAMRLLVDEVTLCSASAPSEGAVLSALTPEQIQGGGWKDAAWWFGDLSMSTAEVAQTIAEDVEVSESGTMTDAGTCFLYENMQGWTDLSAFAADGFDSDPSVTDPTCTGYYLAVTYRYAMVPDASLSEDSPEVTVVKKYIPLSPVVRSNEYRIDITVNMSEIVVSGATESSEEVSGKW